MEIRKNLNKENNKSILHLINYDVSFLSKHEQNRHLSFEILILEDMKNLDMKFVKNFFKRLENLTILNCKPIFALNFYFEQLNVLDNNNLKKLNLPNNDLRYIPNLKNMNNLNS